MVSAVTLALVLLPLFWLYSQYASLQKNIKAAKQSGLPYIVVPVDLHNILWLISHKFWIRILEKLPKQWTENWLELIHPHWPYDKLYEPCAKHGDVFLTASPGTNILWVTDADAIIQITQRREAFPKALESYKVLNIFGRSLLTTEGSEWKQHRKVSAPSFNEKNNALVFREAIASTQGMLRKWTAKQNTTLEDPGLDSMRVTLHIISMIGFGVRLFWPGEGPDNKLPAGHTMSFEESLTVLLDKLILVLLLPIWILKRIPIKSANEAAESFENWRQYMNEIMAEKIVESSRGERGEGMDIMGALVKSSYEKGKPKVHPEKGNGGNGGLSDADILGNAFVMIVAGHETTANAVHFSLVELAINIDSQRRLQKEIQTMVGDTPPEGWDYDKIINELLGSMVGAVMNEVLRLMPPVVNIPKSVLKDADQSLFVDGKKVIIPKGSRVFLNVVGIHRSPKYWPSGGPSKVDGRPDDLNDYIPERWLVKDESSAKQSNSAVPSEELEKDEFGGFTGRDSSARLFRPIRGSYLPFSEGGRSCVGRRLAQVEVMAVLAVIFQKYSIELAVDEWATDEEVEKMSAPQRKELYLKAIANATKTLRQATTRLTLKLHDGDGYIPVRVMEKGKERFFDVIE